MIATCSACGEPLIFMANFLENMFASLQKAADRVVLREVRGEEFVSVTGRQLLEQVAERPSVYSAEAACNAGDRCALLGPNSIQWAAIDLALMAEGIIVVPFVFAASAGRTRGHDAGFGRRGYCL